AMRHQQQNSAVDIIQADILAKELTAVADVVVSSFGLKTFSQSQQVQLAKTLRRILKPGIFFVVSEISVPPSTFLRWPYLFYLRHVIPFMGRLFLRISTEGFGDASRFA